MRRVVLVIGLVLMAAAAAGIASAANPGGEAAQGTGPRTLAYHVQRDVTGEEIPILVTQEPPYTNVLEIHLPPISGKEAYLGTATFTLVNFGPTDANVHCGVGNRMGHELFVPVNQLSNPSLGGMPGADSATYTLTGLIGHAESMALGCHLFTWVGAAQGTPAPDVGFRRGTLEVLYVSKLRDLTPAE
jgi:hypothetical protein